MAKKIPFPIKTQTACLLKWNWNSIWLTRGTTSSCHRNLHVKIHKDNFDNFHNLPYYLDHRRSMLRGEWPHSPDHLGCGYCKRIEDAGGQSDRLFMTKTQTDQTPDELNDNPTAIHVTPAVLEVFLSNTCNFMCTYCSVNESSKIESEVKKYNIEHSDFNQKYFGKLSDNLSKEEIIEYKNLLINWLKKNGSKLRRLHILGGEPFYNKDFLEFINLWNNRPNPNLIINVVSNVGVSPKKFKNQIEHITNLIKNKCIEEFEITASIDCWGPQLEYVRTGAKCDVIEENILYYLNLPTTKYLNINSTHSLMSFPYYYLLLKKKKEWEDKTGKTIRLYSMPVSSEHVALDTLGGEFIKKSTKKILQIHEKKSWDDNQALKNLSGQIKWIFDKSADIQKIKNFIEVYNELDRRRNTNWQKVFPEIAAEIEKYKDGLV